MTNSIQLGSASQDTKPILQQIYWTIVHNCFLSASRNFPDISHKVIVKMSNVMIGKHLLWPELPHRVECNIPNMQLTRVALDFAEVIHIP